MCDQDWKNSIKDFVAIGKLEARRVELPCIAKNVHFFPLVKEFRTFIKRLSLLQCATVVKRKLLLSKRPSNMICLVFFSREMLNSCSKVSFEFTNNNIFAKFWRDVTQKGIWPWFTGEFQADGSAEAAVRQKHSRKHSAHEKIWTHYGHEVHSFWDCKVWVVSDQKVCAGKTREMVAYIFVK
jgi:hypothetical protein